MLEEEQEHTNSVTDAVRYSTEQFDKSITLIASGALGLSFAFLKDILPNISTASYKWLLIFSWVAFAVTILVSLIAHYVSMRMNNYAISIDHLPYKKYNKKIKKKNKPIRYLNISMIVLLFLGILSLVIFISLNL